MRANEIAEGLELGISLDRRRKFLAFLEVGEETIEGALAQRMDCPREALEALARNLVFHGRSPVWGSADGACNIGFEDYFPSALPKRSLKIGKKLFDMLRRAASCFFRQSRGWGCGAYRACRDPFLRRGRPRRAAGVAP